MTSNGRAWGIILSCALAGVGSCESDDTTGGGDGGAGAGGEATQAGVPNVEAGASPGKAGGSATSGGANPGGQAGENGGGGSDQAVGGGGGQPGSGAVGAGEAGQGPGGSNGEGTPPTPPSCPDGASGAYNRWYPLGGAGGADSDAFHRLPIGNEQTAIAINGSGQMLVTSSWEASDSCQAWIVDADSVTEVTAATSGCVRAVDMNEAGTVLASQSSVPFLWRDGVAAPLDGVVSGTPVALNDAEQVLLQATEQGPVLWESGNVTPLRTPADAALEPVAINESGEIVGFSGEGVGTWLWVDGLATELDLQEVHALNDVGDIAGVQTGKGAGVLSGGTFTPLSIMAETVLENMLDSSDWNDIRINVIADTGAILGDRYVIGETDLAQPFHLEAGVMRFLETFGSARGINEHDEIVGRRAAFRFGPPRSESWTIEDYWPTLWVRDCPSACCAP